MPKKLQKSLSDYLYRIKKQAPHFHFSHNNSISATTSKILSGCKYPKSLSFSGDRKGRLKTHHDQVDDIDEKRASATMEDIEKFLYENFNTLYCQDHVHVNIDDHSDDESTYKENKGKSITQEFQLGPKRDITSLGGVGILFDSPRFFTPPRDLHRSNRFFISSPSSGSLTEEAGINGMGTTSVSEDGGSTSTPIRDTRGGHLPNYFKSDTSADPGQVVEDCITLLKVTPSPYEDFRRSMQEVIDARVRNNQRVDWDYIEELLFCYLRLNEKKHYRYILSAFVDLVEVLRQSGPEGSCC